MSAFYVPSRASSCVCSQMTSWLSPCAGSVALSSSSTSKYDSSRDPEGRGPDFTQPPAVTTFPLRLLSLLRGGGGEGVREGVGGVCRQQMAAARADLLSSLEGAQSQLLSPEVSRRRVTPSRFDVNFVQKAVSILCQHYEGLRADVERRLALVSVLASDLAVDHSSIQHSTNQLSQLSQEVYMIHSHFPYSDSVIFSFSHTLIRPFHLVGKVRGDSAEVRVQPAAGPDSILLGPLHPDLETGLRTPVPGGSAGRHPGQSESQDTIFGQHTGRSFRTMYDIDNKLPEKTVGHTRTIDKMHTPFHLNVCFLINRSRLRLLVIPPPPTSSQRWRITSASSWASGSPPLSWTSSSSPGRAPAISWRKWVEPHAPSLAKALNSIRYSCSLSLSLSR